MLFSLSILFLSALFLGFLAKKLSLPALIGMIGTGILLGPYVLNLIDPSLLSISPALRQIALVIILTRAGLSLDPTDLKKVGRPAVLLCFLPALLEITGMAIFAPLLLGLSLPEALLLGAVVGAVSPAVIVPKMLHLMEEGYGTKESIPQMILAGASLDDVFVIVLFSAFLGFTSDGTLDLLSIFTIPVSILLGGGVGVLSGLLLSLFFSKFHMRDTVKVLILLSISFLLITLENADLLPFSGLVGVITMNIALSRKKPVLSKRLTSKFNKLWVGAELLLFVLVGALVNPQVVLSAGLPAVLLLFLALLFRMLGVFFCTLGTKIQWKERLFCMIAYLPKATVQAAIGGIPLSMGLACGDVVLTVAVLAIVITAPLGAFLIDLTHKKLLKKDLDETTESVV